MAREFSLHLDNYYRRLTSDGALSQMELLKEQNLIGYIEGYLSAKGFFGFSKEDDAKKFYDKLYRIHEEKKIKNLSLPDLKALSKEYIDSCLIEKIQK